MKKILLCIIACLGIGLATVQPVKAYAEEPISSEVTSSEEESIIEYPCKVAIAKTIGGEILTDIEEGNVGDIVTLHISPYLLYKIKVVKANGIDLIADAEGNYSFALIEGSNEIYVEFDVDNEKLELAAEILAQAKEGNWEQIFSVENILTVISWIITTIFSSGFLLTLIKNKKLKSKTAEEIAVSVEGKVEKATAHAINNFLNTTLEPVTSKMSNGLNDMEESMKILIRCFVLSQEDTPESRLAIIKELSNLKTTSQELSEQVKMLINEEILKNKKAEEEKKNTLKELKAANEAILPKEEVVDEDIKGSY